MTDPETPRESTDLCDLPKIFVAGCERTGTTALTYLLYHDARIAVGRERFKYIRDDVRRKHFNPDHFFSPAPEETNYLNEQYYRTLKDRWLAGSLRYVGDKVPLYYKNLDTLEKRFGSQDLKLLFTIRNLESVAASYNRRAQEPSDRHWEQSRDYTQAVKDWNQSLSLLRKYYFNGGKDKIFLVRYEDFFAGNLSYLKALYRFLALPLTLEVVEAFHDITIDWHRRMRKDPQLTAAMKDHLHERKNVALETWCMRLIPPIVSPRHDY